MFLLPQGAETPEVVAPDPTIDEVIVLLVHLCRILGGPLGEGRFGHILGDMGVRGPLWGILDPPRGRKIDVWAREDNFETIWKNQIFDHFGPILPTGTPYPGGVMPRIWR